MPIFRITVPTIRQLIVWSFFPIVITVVSLLLISFPITRILAVGAIVLVWAVTIFSLFLRLLVAALLNPLRRRVFVFWIFCLLYLVAGVLGWQLVSRITTCVALGEIGLEQIPCFNNSARIFNLISGLEHTGSAPTLELLYLLVAVWGLIFIIGFGLGSDERRSMGRQLANAHLTNVLVSVTMIIVALLGLEVATRLVLDTTAGTDQILIQQQWMSRHWDPINSLGYRDNPIEGNLDENRQQILITGDSYASGWGVKNFEDTFGQRIATSYEASHQVRIVARPGWDTITELDQLQLYPVSPDVLIVSYVFNDIEYVSPEARDVYFSNFQSNYAAPFQFTTMYLYLPNLLSKTIFSPRSDKSYLDFLYELYSEPDVWSQQEANIQNLLDWAEEQEAQVIGLIWPDLAELEKSQPLVDQVETVFEDQGHLTVNLGEVLTGQDSTTLVASPFDNHANAYTHGIVGEQLVEAIATLGDID